MRDIFLLCNIMHSGSLKLSDFFFSKSRKPSSRVKNGPPLIPISRAKMGHRGSFQKQLQVDSFSCARGLGASKDTKDGDR